MLCSEKLPLWKLVIQLVRLPGKLQKRKPHTTFPFIFLTISSCLSKFLNTHSGRIHWIRHSQGLGRSLKMDTCLEVQKIEIEQCTVQNCYTTRIPKYEHCPVEESRSIMASSWKEKKHTWLCIKVGCPRPAVTFSLLSSSPQKQTRVRFDSAIRSPVPQRDEENGMWGKDPLTSVPLHLLRRWTPCQTEGWGELRPGATTAAPGSFGFDDTETKKDKNRHRLVRSSERIEILQCITVT